MLLFATALLAAANVSTAPAGDMPMINPAPEPSFCPETPMALARRMGKQSPKAIPLSKLPPAQAFMAVDRRIAGCPAPLTMIQYRGGSRR